MISMNAILSRRVVAAGHRARRWFGVLLLLPALALAGSYDDYFEAVHMDDARVLRQLLQRGLSPNMVEAQRGYNGMMLALREDSMSVFTVLFNTPGVDLEAHAKNGDTVLMLAAFHGYPAVVRELLAREVEVNGPGWTALHYAAINGNPQSIKALLDASAYIDAESPEGKMTPIMLAAVRGRVGAVKLLREEGADISLKNSDGLTALDLARRAHQDEVIEILSAPVP